jgi:hypothetical protein
MGFDVECVGRCGGADEGSGGDQLDKLYSVPSGCGGGRAARKAGLSMSVVRRGLLLTSGLVILWIEKRASEPIDSDSMRFVSHAPAKDLPVDNASPRARTRKCKHGPADEDHPCATCDVQTLVASAQGSHGAGKSGHAATERL